MEQLVRETGYANTKATIWTYDLSGNITAKYDTSYYTAPTSIIMGMLTEPYCTPTAYSYSASTWGDLLTNYDGTTISYDKLGSGWVRAKELKVGDIILLLDGTQAIVESVEFEHLSEPVKVYNFEVEDYHTYFVGHDGWLVHNVCVSGFTEHGLQQVMARDGHGVSNVSLLNTINSPIDVIYQANRGTNLYIGSDSKVVLNSNGMVVTAWATSHTGWRY